MGATVNAMIEAVTAGLTTIIGWIGTTIDAIVGEAGQLGELLPLFAIGISISAILLGIKVIRSIVWGA